MPDKPVPGRRRMVIRLVMALLACLFFGPYVASRCENWDRRLQKFGVDGAEALVAEPQLRIVTYNIAHGRGSTDSNWQEAGEPKKARIERIAARLRELSADIVILNEVDFESTWSGGQNQAQAIAESAGFPFRVEQVNFNVRFPGLEWRFGNAILSRFPIVECEDIEYPVYSATEHLLAGSKQGFAATLQVGPRQRLQVIAVHLEPRQEATRVGSVRTLLKTLANRSVPTVMAGDFNSTSGGFPGFESDPQGNNALELLRDSRRFLIRPVDPPQSSGYTFSVGQPTKVIDWIMVPRSGQIIDYEVLDWDLSDHRPVIATVRIADSSQVGP